MIKDANNFLEKKDSPHRLPLMILQGSGIKSAIRKNKYLAEIREEKKNISTSIKKARYTIHMEGVKKNLSIQIPKETEPKPFILGSKVKSGSNFADTSESGAFYGLTLKKGQFRRFNEDRVIHIYNLNLLVHCTTIYFRCSYRSHCRSF